MTDEQHAAEQLDGEVLEPGDRTKDLPGLDEFVDIGPMSAEDPELLMGSTEASDSDVVRDWREEPEVDSDTAPIDERPVISLLDQGDPNELDDEEELLGDAVHPEDGRVGPEDAALHIEPDR